MIIIYIYNKSNLTLLITNVHNFLNKSNLLNKQFDITIYSNVIPSINHDLKIVNYDHSNYYLCKNIESIEYEYVIEMDDNFDLNILLSYDFNSNNNIVCNFINNKLENYFSDDDIKLLPKIIKNKNTNINNFPDSIKIYNLDNLRKINWINTMDYLQNKCKELNIDVNNQKLLILFQLLYPQYITLQEFEKYKEVEVKEDEKIIEIKKEILIKNIWLIKRSSCKVLLNNYVLSIEDTILKKNCVQENKADPTDKINIRIGRKLKLCSSQNLNHFYIVEY